MVETIERRGSTYKWPQNKIDILTEMWKAGKSARRIGDVLGLSRMSVIGKAWRLNLPDRAQDNGKRSYKSASDWTSNTRATSRGDDIETIAITLPPIKAKPCQTPLHIVHPRPSTGRVSVVDVTECRWPVGEENGRYHFCNATRDVGSSYCPHHREANKRKKS